MVSDTTIIIVSTKETGKYPCCICHKGVGRSSIYCNHCKYWVHKKCSICKGRLQDNKIDRCRKCLQAEHVMVAGAALEVVDKFYIGNMISAGGSAEESEIARTRSGWKAFRDLPPVLTCRGFSLCSKVRVYQHVYGSETWVVKEADLLRWECNDKRMIRWMCNVALKDRKPSSELREHLGLDSIRSCIRRGRSRWFQEMQ